MNTNSRSANTEGNITIQKLKNFFVPQNKSHWNYELCLREETFNITMHTRLNITCMALLSMSMTEMFFTQVNKISLSGSPWVSSLD